MKLKITNTLTKQEEFFTPLQEGKVNLYVCGITPYDYAHLGHGRAYVHFDFLLRLLRQLGYDVAYARNFTDIDDKLINRAQEMGGNTTYKDVAEKFIAAYTDDMQALNCITPEYEPRVTECIPEIIIFIEELIKKEHAYVIDNDVYFDISTFKEYGKLSGRDLNDLLAGARVDVDERKKNASDFALWKGNNNNEYWQSPWGYGRPGWHIECSVMAKKHLGQTIDIHGGGMDLIFPHHENEIAQTEALHDKPFANYWIHNAFVNVNKVKMSKSLGNFMTLHEAFKTVDPMVLRYFFLQHHYTTPIDFNPVDVDAAKTAYKKLCSHFSDPSLTILNSKQCKQFAEQSDIANTMLQALCNNLNTPKLLGLVFENLATIKTSLELANFIYTMLSGILGLTLQPFKEQTLDITPEIQALLDERTQAREQKDWARADAIRDQLTAMGYQAQDKKIG
ncbi:MAG: cysteine--tRNA ligase [Epsilonproteobacteria bacterium]|nr:cysteine--tRNA ligase [Campylobacterota bacterium]